ncbi:MAG: hypothetical protein ACI97K_002120 [Glaciecola sp.]|jgi:hypothetical protein
MLALYHAFVFQHYTREALHNVMNSGEPSIRFEIYFVSRFFKQLILSKAVLLHINTNSNTFPW